MVKYMIHACNQRRWYVDEHLLPSMINQGIDKDNIIVYTDYSDGCLIASIKSFEMSGKEEDVDGFWHIQDDVLICSDFKQKTEEYNNGLICAFASEYDKVGPGYAKGIDQMWFSFPCIRIPNNLLRHYTTWFYSYFLNDVRYQAWIKLGKHDDLLFRYFLGCYYKDIEAFNLAPNLVEHVDWLLGGSTVNRQRGNIIRSKFWEEEQLVTNLKNILNSC